MSNPHPSIPSDGEELNTSEKLAKFLIEYEFTRPRARYSTRLELQRYYAKLIDKYAQKKYQKVELKGRIDELSMVQSGHYVAQTFVNGQAMTVEKRINDLESQYKERSKAK